MHEISNLEKEILYLVIKGMSDSEIMSKLSLSEDKFKNVVLSVMKKLNAKNAFQAGVIAIKENIIL